LRRARIFFGVENAAGSVTVRRPAADTAIEPILRIAQAFKIIRDRDASGVSALTYAMVLAGALLWGAYGVLRAAPSIMLWNAVAALLAGTVLFLKLTAKPS
jgi:uncharacterized protein with PQ loop repeat